MYALKDLVNDAGKIPFWTLFAVYWIQSIGELCLSPIGLSMTTKLAPSRLNGFAMGAWFLSIAIGNNLAGMFAGEASGDSGMTTTSALSAYTPVSYTHLDVYKRQVLLTKHAPKDAARLPLRTLPSARSVLPVAPKL